MTGRLTMDDERRKEVITAALNRRVEMSPEAKEKLETFNATQEDWYGVCQKCFKRLKGTMAAIRSHRCNDGA